MGKINILSEELCNRISAGEVIERPFSVVKELVENSIDAGATEIEISIERGGKDSVTVSDNGCGIEKDDMRPAFFAHATSKIKDLDDISHIRTLGFRGEALATIASIALVELVSAVEGQDANKVECNGDFIGKVEPAVAPKGTKITVKNLFFNTPVRFKFMKSDKKEEADITTYVTRYILGRPDISFKYFVDGQLKLQSYGGGLEEAITQVYGAKVLPNCYKIKAERNDIKLSGFISNQQYFKANKSYQTLFLNGRYVNNQILASAINNAYGPYMMKKNYPFFVLYVDMSDDYVDVNVHPNKTDVRFSEPSLIYGTVYKIITTVLDGTVKAADFVVPDDGTTLKTEQTAINVPAPVHSYMAEFVSNENVTDKDFSDVKDIEKYTAQPKVQKKPSAFDGMDFSAYEDYAPGDFTRNIKTEDLLTPRFGDTEDRHTLTLGTSTNLSLRAQAALEEDMAREKARQQEILFMQSKYRGTLFNTYLLYELKDDVYMIDQHAAHERLLYDKLMAKMQSRKAPRQATMYPYVFPVTPEERAFLDENGLAIWQLGFTIEPFGHNAFRVSEVPIDMYDINAEELFKDILSHMGEYKQLSAVDLFKDKMAQTACKHAVKGGEELTEEERDELFSMIRGNVGLKCPHGRPICVKLTKTDVEKMFKRKL